MASGPRPPSLAGRRSLLKRGTRNSASPTPPCDQPDARAIEITGGPRETLSLQTIGPHVWLRGAAGVAALAAAAPLASVPTRTVTVQQARSATGLPRSSKENDEQLKAILSTVAGGQLRLSWLWRSLVVGERRGLDAASIGVVAVIASPASTVGCAKEAVDWTPGGPRRHGPCPYYSAANALHPTAEARASAVLAKLSLVRRDS